MNENRLAVLMLLAAAIFWSTSGVLIKLVALHPMAIAGWRSLIAGGVILLLCRKEVKVSWGVNPVLAAACMGLFCICFVVATKLTTAANAIVLQYAASAYVAILAPRMLGEPTRRQDWYFLSLVVAGIALFFRYAFPARHHGHSGGHGRVAFLGRCHDFSAKISKWLYRLAHRFRQFHGRGLVSAVHVPASTHVDGLAWPGGPGRYFAGGRLRGFCLCHQAG